MAHEDDQVRHFGRISEMLIDRLADDLESWMDRGNCVTRREQSDQMSSNPDEVDKALAACVGCPVIEEVA